MRRKPSKDWNGVKAEEGFCAFAGRDPAQGLPLALRDEPCSFGSNAIAEAATSRTKMEPRRPIARGDTSSLIEFLQEYGPMTHECRNDDVAETPSGGSGSRAEDCSAPGEAHSLPLLDLFD